MFYLLRLICKWLPAAVWMALIFMGSTDILSAAHTSRFVEPFLRWLFVGHLSQREIEQAHFFIRKCGHVTEYAVLALLYRYALGFSRGETAPEQAWSGRWQKTLIAGFLASAYAGTDEFHQTFVPGRTGCVSDVLIDTAGAAVGLAFLALVRWGWASARRRGSRDSKPLSS